MSLIIDPERARHAQYAHVLKLLEDLAEGSEGETREEILKGITCLDAVYVSGGRITQGPIDGDPE